jgi:hypothetical protein
MRWRSALQCWWQGLSPTSNVTKRQPNALQRWQNWHWPRSNTIANNNSNGDGDGKDGRNGDYGTNNPLQK